MRIKKIQAEKIRLTLTEPITVAFGTVEYLENVVIKMDTDEGIAGYGEAAPMPFVNGETADSVLAALRLFEAAIAGDNPLEIADVHKKMEAALYHNGAAKCAVDLALHDIWGKAMSLPVFRLLGGAEPTVQNDVTIGIGPMSWVLEKARHYAEAMGYRVLKIKAGVDPAHDIEVIKEIRRTLGAGVRLRVDANQGYDLKSAVAAVEAFGALGVEAVEQCLPWWDFEGNAELKRHAGAVKIMLDESIHDVHDASRACAENAADILNIKLMKCGGLYPAMKIADIAQAQGLSCMVGCMIESPIAITAGLSLVAAHPAATDADCDSYMYYTNTTGVEGSYTIEGDEVKLPELPGLGVKMPF